MAMPTLNRNKQQDNPIARLLSLVPQRGTAPVQSVLRPPVLTPQSLPIAPDPDPEFAPMGPVDAGFLAPPPVPAGPVVAGPRRSIPDRAQYFANTGEYQNAPIYNAPERNIQGDSRNTSLGAGLAGLISLLTGNGQHVGAVMGGYAQGSKAGQDENYLNREQIAQGRYQTDAQRVGNNNLGVDRRTRTAQNAYAGDVATYNAGVKADTAAEAARQRAEAARLRSQPKPPTEAELLKERDGIMSHLSELDPASQQQYIGLLDRSGDYKRLFGEDPEKDEAGKYLDSYKKAPPVKAAADPAIAEAKKAEADAKAKDDATKDRYSRLRSEVSQSLTEYRDTHTTEPRRREIERRLQFIKTNVPAAWNGSVPRPGSRSALTPQETITNARIKSNADKTGSKPAALSPLAKARNSELSKEQTTLLQIISNPRSSDELKARSIKRYRQITQYTGKGVHVLIRPGDIANMTPGQQGSAARAESKAYSDAAKKTKILSIEEIKP